MYFRLVYFSMEETYRMKIFESVRVGDISELQGLVPSISMYSKI